MPRACQMRDRLPVWLGQALGSVCDKPSTLPKVVVLLLRVVAGSAASALFVALLR
jgi:hypothetical protein